MNSTEDAETDSARHDAWFRGQVESALKKLREGNAKFFSLKEVQERLHARIRARRERVARDGK